MLRIVFPIVLVLIFTSVSGYFLYTRSARTADDYQTATPFRTDIDKTIIANGTITPRKQVLIKPQISGVIHAIYVKPGDAIKKNDPIALIQPYPDPIDVSAAEGTLRDARIRYQYQQRDYTRTNQLFKEGFLPQVEFEQSQMALKLSRQSLATAQRNLEIVKSGASTELSRSASEVRATVSGLVLERTVELGTFVIESNTFNEGTTIVTIADMADLVFKGQVDEPDAGMLSLGIPTTLTVGAFPDSVFTGAIEFISPKATVKDGRITFEVRSSLSLSADIFVRAGYSAVAEIVVDRREQVLAIPERYLTFEDSEPFVRVEVGAGVFEDRPLSLGLSNGLVVEIKDGIGEGDIFRIAAKE